MAPVGPASQAAVEGRGLYWSYGWHCHQLTGTVQSVTIPLGIRGQEEEPGAECLSTQPGVMAWGVCSRQQTDSMRAQSGERVAWWVADIGGLRVGVLSGVVPPCTQRSLETWSLLKNFCNCI